MPAPATPVAAKSMDCAARQSCIPRSRRDGLDDHLKCRPRVEVKRRRFNERMVFWRLQDNLPQLAPVRATNRSCSLGVHGRRYDLCRRAARQWRRGRIADHKASDAGTSNGRQGGRSSPIDERNHGLVRRVSSLSAKGRFHRISNALPQTSCFLPLGDTPRRHESPAFLFGDGDSRQSRSPHSYMPFPLV